MHDKQNKAGIWMIDFAKTLRVEGRKLSHRAPWVVGNHEDGYLTGVAHLTEVRFSYNHAILQPLAKSAILNYLILSNVF